MWYRVELDRTGSILKCEEASASEANGRLVRFIEAPNRTEACSLVKQWYERRKEVRRRSDNKRTATRKAKGICRNCSRPIAADSALHCEFHKAEQAKAQRRWARGESGRGPVMSPEQAYERQREAHKRFLRRQVQLAIVLQKFDELGPVRFRAWVVEQLRITEADAGERAEAAE